MLIAHIKSESGEKTEEWDDWRVPESQLEFVEAGHVYVISFESEGEKVEGVLPKYLWLINDELSYVASGIGGVYTALPEFVRSMVAELAAILSEASQIESHFNVQDNNYTPFEEYINALLALEKRAYLAYEKFEVPRSTLENVEPAGNEEDVLITTINALSDFSLHIRQDIKQLGEIVVGLAQRQSGNKQNYSTMSYFNDAQSLAAMQDNRRAEQESLAEVREAFARTFPDSI